MGAQRVGGRGRSTPGPRAPVTCECAARARPVTVALAASPWLGPSGASGAGSTERSCAGCEAERSVGRGACGRESESEGLAAPRAADAPAESSAPPAGTNELVRCSPRSAPGASVSELPPPPPSPAAAAVPLPSSETREPEAEERLGVETTR